MNLIVTFNDGRILERDRIRIHATSDDANTYGKSVYGYGQFIVRRFNLWKKSRIGKHQIEKINIINRLNKFK